jgi:hypothetical protein
MSAYVSIRQHSSAYVSIRQHTSAYVSIRQHSSAFVSIRQHTSAYVSIRQHTSAYIPSSASSSGRFIRTPRRRLLRQYLYCCTSKASKLSTVTVAAPPTHQTRHPDPSRRQYLYFCTSKASTLRTFAGELACQKCIRCVTHTQLKAPYTTRLRPHTLLG